MKAIRIERHGGPEVLEVVDMPAPEPGPGEVRVRVTHVGLNHLDVWVRRGVEGHTFPLPLVPCSDVVGVREDTGEPVALFPAHPCLRCARCLEGRHELCRDYRIRGEHMDGGACERVVARHEELLPLGDLPPDRAAALPLSLLTAWHMLVGRAALRPGQRVLVQAGAGGVGSLAIQVARHLGARVVATASTEDKRALCRALGAEEAWSYDDAPRACKAWSGGQGVDVVVEHVGAATWGCSMKVLRWGGTLVTCGATAGHVVDLNLRVLFFKQLSLLGSTMGSIPELRAAWEAVRDGRIRPVVDRVLPLSAIGRGHDLLASRKVMGKIVLEQDLG